jgi:selenocysteine-specific elongation factor
MRMQAGNSDAALRLPIDRSFVMKGFGTVVTGTLLSGVIHEGQSLVLEPGARSVRVRGLQTHGRSEPSARSGSRVAVNLSGIDASEVHRGQTLVAVDTLSPVDAVDAEVRVLPTAPALKHRARIHLHAFTSEVMATVSVYGYEDIRPGTTALMRLKLDKPIVLAPGDRFVLRQPAPVATIGGGRILDCTPEPRQRKSATLAFLEHLRHASIPEQLVLRVKCRGTAGIHIDTLAREAGLALEATRRHIEPAIQQGDILLVEGHLLLSRAAMQKATNQILTLPSRLGASTIKSSELRGQTGLSPAVFHFAVTELAREGKIQIRGEGLSLDAGPAISASDSRLLATIAAAYEAAGLAAPLVSELAQRFRMSETEMRRLITLLQRQKTIIRMGSDDLFIHVDALDHLISRMAPLRGTLIDVARFKELTGLSRKYAIPLLEYLDRGRITRKQGDQRLVL